MQPTLGGLRAPQRGMRPPPPRSHRLHQSDDHQRRKGVLREGDVELSCDCHGTRGDAVLGPKQGGEKRIRLGVHISRIGKRWGLPEALWPPRLIQRDRATRVRSRAGAVVVEAAPAPVAPFA